MTRITDGADITLICLFLVTWNFTIGSVGRKLFYFHEVFKPYYEYKYILLIYIFYRHFIIVIKYFCVIIPQVHATLSKHRRNTNTYKHNSLFIPLDLAYHSTFVGMKILSDFHQCFQYNLF